MFKTTGVAQLDGCSPSQREVAGSILGQATCLGFRPVSVGVHARGNQLMFLSHQCFSPSFSPSLPLSLKINIQKNDMEELMAKAWVYSQCILYLSFFFKKDFIYFLVRGRETLISCLSRAPNWGPGLWPRHMPWLGIELVTFRFTGQCSIPWTTPARAQWTLYLFSFIWKPNHLSGKVNSLDSLLIKNVRDSMKFPISLISSPSQKDSEGTEWHSGYSELTHSENKNPSLPRWGKGLRRQAEQRTAVASLVCFLRKLSTEKTTGKPRG